MTSAVIAGDTLPAFIGTLPGSHAPVREYDTRGNGGGLQHYEPPFSVSPACRAPNGAFPPFGGGKVAVRGGKAPKSQTTSAKNIENGVLRLRWSAFWAQRCTA